MNHNLDDWNRVKKSLYPVTHGQHTGEGGKGQWLRHEKRNTIIARQEGYDLVGFTQSWLQSDSMQLLVDLNRKEIRSPLYYHLQTR